MAESSDPMRVNACDVSPVEPFPGVLRRTLTWGQHSMLSMTEIAVGAELPEHAHEHEQITYILKGELEFRIEGKTLVLIAGDCITVPSHARHWGKAREDTVALDAFSPPREDFKAI